MTSKWPQIDFSFPFDDTKYSPLGKKSYREKENEFDCEVARLASSPTYLYPAYARNLLYQNSKLCFTGHEIEIKISSLTGSCSAGLGHKRATGEKSTKNY